MKPCESIRERLIDLRYGLLDDDAAQACRRHVSTCPVCAAELRLLDAVAGSLRSDEAFPREGEVDWAQFARVTVGRAMAGIAPRPHAAPPARWLDRFASAFTLPAVPAWSAAAALVAVTVLGFVSYQYLPRTTGPAAVQTASVFVAEDGLDNLTVNLARQNTAKYINETRAVLVTLLDVNIECDTDKVDITAERAKATELLRRQRLIATELHRYPLARAEDVCNDLERLLLEISSLGDCTKDEEIKTLRDVVEKRQILVRMELLSQELAKRGGASA